MREEDESNIRDGWADIEDQRVDPDESIRLDGTRLSEPPAPRCGSCLWCRTGSRHCMNERLAPERKLPKRQLPLVSPEAAALEEADRRLPVRTADVAQYAREPIPAEQRGQIRVRLLNATPDPLGSIAALGKQYKGEVVRSLAEVTNEERRAYFEDFGKTVLNGPLEAAQFHFQIEGVTRSITHQMVRSRASFFAQESLRFAVPEGEWRLEIPLPPWLSSVRRRDFAAWTEDEQRGIHPDYTPQELALDEWEDALIHLQSKYQRLIELGMPAEEARGLLPHDMPTRIHWVLDLRTLLAEAGKRTCTQAQFPWRLIFAGIAKALRRWGNTDLGASGHLGDGWQFALIADKLRPVCFQTGQCGFMAQFDRNCSIRSRVDSFAISGIPSAEWGQRHEVAHANGVEVIEPIKDWEWAADPGAARA